MLSSVVRLLGRALSLAERAALRSWLESLALTGLMSAMIFGLGRDGRLDAAAAWLALVPPLVALKHGLLPGGFACLAWVASSVVAGAALTSESGIHDLLPVAVMTLAAGHFRDHWHASRASLQARADTQARDLEALFRSYGVLRASHAELEERLSAESWSLAGAVREAERQVRQRSGESAAATLLELLATHGKVRAASLYVCEQGELAPQPLAQLGPPTRSDGRHELVRLARERQLMVSFDPSEHDALEGPAPVLLAIPLLTTSARLIGVVSIHELPLLSLHEAHFARLATLAGSLADALAARLDERTGSTPPSARGRSSRPGPGVTTSGIHKRASVPPESSARI